LLVQCLGIITFAQGLLGVVHRLARAAQCLARRVALGCTGTGQVALLAVQFVAQCILAVGQALARFRPARLLALTGLFAFAGCVALSRLLAGLLPRLAGVEPLLKVTRRLIRQALLVTQGIFK